MEKLELKVANVKCGGCASTIQEGLLALPGVASVNVDIATGTVNIDGSDFDAANIQAKLGELGYPVQG
jgi:copper chaperone